MAARAHRVVGFEDFPLFVDKVADASGIACLGIVAGAIGKAHGSGGIAEQGEREAELLREGGVLCYSVKTHSQYFHVLRAKIGNLVAEPAAFGRSPGGVRFGIKPQ